MSQRLRTFIRKNYLRSLTMKSKDVTLIARTYSKQPHLFLSEQGRVTWPRIRSWCSSVDRIDLYEELRELADSKPGDYLQAFVDRRLCLHCGTHPVGYRKKLQYCLHCLELPEVKASARQVVRDRISSTKRDPARVEANQKRLFDRTGFAHPMHNPTVREKVRSTYFDRTGYDNPSYNPEVKKKRRKTQQLNWGASHWLKSASGKASLKKIFKNRFGGHPMKTDAVKSKTKETNAVRYQGGHPLRDPTIKANREDAFLRRYGVRNPAQCPTSKLKSRRTSLERYGVEFPVQSERVKRKTRKTILERTGYSHYSKDPEWFAQNSGNRHKRREVEHCGRTLHLQGYEPQALQILSSVYGAERVFASYEQPDRSVKYRFEGRTRTYHPDLTVVGRHQSMDFEVKSDYTLFKSLEMNRAKAKSSGARTLVVLDRKSLSYKLLPTDWWRLPEETLRQIIASR